MRPSHAQFLKLLVPVKRTVDYAVKIRVGANGVETNGVKFSINPFDEIAVEEAVRLREKHKKDIEDITVITVGPPKATDVLRTALAMGADKAVHIETKEDEIVEPLAVAKLLNAYLASDEGKADLVILGKQAIDDDAGQVGGMLSGLTGWGIANFVSSVAVDGQKLTAEREIDGGLEKVQLDLPGIVTTDLRLNEPRYASLPNIMKAKKKPIAKKTASELGVDLTPRLQTIKVAAPPARQGGVKVEGVDGVVAKLKEVGAI